MIMQPDEDAGFAPDGEGAALAAAFAPAAGSHARPALTWRQRKVLTFIQEHTQAHGYPPTMREIGDAVGLSSVGSVSYVLGILEAKGHIRRGSGKQRAILVSGLAGDQVTVDRADLRAALLAVPDGNCVPAVALARLHEALGEGR